MLRAAASLWIATSIAVATVAHAQEPPIRVAVSECVAAPEFVELFLRSLRVELAGQAQPCCARVGADGAPAPEPHSPFTLTVGPCGPEPAVVNLQVRDERSGAVLGRQVALADVSPQARPRALALASAELVRAAAAPAPAPPAVGVTPATPPQPRDGWLALLGATGRALPSGKVTLWGFRGGVELGRPAWQAAIDVHLETADPSVSLGSVAMSFASASIEVGPRFHPRNTALDLGATGDIGIVHLTGASSAAGAVTGSGSGLAATAGVRGALDFWQVPHDRARARLTVEAGAVIHGVEATVNGRDAAGVTGPYVLAGLAFALGPY